LAHLERGAYQVGLSPQEYRALSFRRLLQVNRAHSEQEKSAWQRTSVLAANIINHAGMGAPDGGAVKPSEVIPWAFGNAGETRRGMSRERYEANMEKHRQRITREQKQTEANG